LQNTAVSYCAESAGECNVQRGNNARAADAFGCKKVFHKIFSQIPAKKRTAKNRPLFNLLLLGFFNDVFSDYIGLPKTIKTFRFVRNEF